jgi:cytochrome c biogenesis protein
LANASAHTSPERSPVEISVDRVWRYFCSVRAAVAEIAFLALLVLIGTLRGSEVPAWLADGIPALQPVVDRWYAWDVFRSPLFAGILALLSIAIAVCTINRVPGIWQTISEPRVRTSAGYLERAETSARFTTTLPAEGLAASYGEVLKGKRYRVMTEEVGTETHIYADKNRYGKMGTFPFHLALILLLVGGIVGAHYGFREPEFVIPEGQTREVGNGTDLSVELVQFQDSYTPMGIAEQYEADIVVYDGNDEVRRETISPNHPVSYRSTTFYQSGFGYGAQMRVTDATGNEVYNGAVDVGLFNFAGNPDAPAGFVEIPGAGATMTIVAPDTLPMNAPELDTLQLKNGQMYVLVQPTGGTAAQRQAIVVDQGQPVQVGGLTVEFQREVRWANLQVAYNPGIPIFIIAAVLLVGGLVVTFYFPLRRVRAMVTQGPNGTVLLAVPLAKRDWSGKREFVRIAELAGERLGVKPVIKRPADQMEWEGAPLSTSPGSGTG